MNNVDIKTFILVILVFVIIIVLGIMPLIAYISVLLINFIFDLTLAFSYLQYVALGILISIVRCIFFIPPHTKKKN